MNLDFPHSASARRITLTDCATGRAIHVFARDVRSVADGGDPRGLRIVKDDDTPADTCANVYLHPGPAIRVRESVEEVLALVDGQEEVTHLFLEALAEVRRLCNSLSEFDADPDWVAAAFRTVWILNPDVACAPHAAGTLVGDILRAGRLDPMIAAELRRSFLIGGPR